MDEQNVCFSALATKTQRSANVRGTDRSSTIRYARGVTRLQSDCVLKANSRSNKKLHIEKDLDYKEKAQYKAAKLSKKERKKDAKRKAREFFFDYNTVEQVLLACAILVCLAGVMFESDRFQAKDASGKLRYGWMRDFVTYWIITVVIASLFYLVLVTMSEVIGYTPQCLQKLFCEIMNFEMSPTGCQEINGTPRKMH